ncbi:hypothetical protein ACPCUV_07240 [Streptomyces platensis]|uniref:hypothetical protein n=1 Tax=Streptomyces platensis TaxID=58346 RepID=UPI003C2CAA1F
MPGVTLCGRRRCIGSRFLIDDQALAERAAARASGASTPMLLARSCRTSVLSLERYVRPGVDAVARHVAQSAPAARRKR